MIPVAENPNRYVDPGKGLTPAPFMENQKAINRSRRGYRMGVALLGHSPLFRQEVSAGLFGGQGLMT